MACLKVRRGVTISGNAVIQIPGIIRIMRFIIDLLPNGGIHRGFDRSATASHQRRINTQFAQPTIMLLSRRRYHLTMLLIRDITSHKDMSSMMRRA